MIRTDPRSAVATEGPSRMTVSSLKPPLRFNSPTAVLNALRGHGLRISTARRVVVGALFAAYSPETGLRVADWAQPVGQAWRQGQIADTRQLAEVVAGAIPRKAWPRDIHPATRTFQALRIAVNDELGALGDWLLQLPRIVARGGRAAAISFHSLEDRLVKQGFAKLATGCTCPPQLPVCACGRVAQWNNARG